MGHIRCSSVVTAVAAIAALVFAGADDRPLGAQPDRDRSYMGGTDHPLSIPRTPRRSSTDT